MEKYKAKTEIRSHVKDVLEEDLDVADSDMEVVEVDIDADNQNVMDQHQKAMELPENQKVNAVTVHMSVMEMEMDIHAIAEEVSDVVVDSAEVQEGVQEPVAGQVVHVAVIIPTMNPKMFGNDSH